MSQCHPAARSRAQRAADELADHVHVAAVDVLEPEADPTDRWTVDLVTEPDSKGLRPDIAQLLGQHGLSIRVCQPQGDCWQIVAVA